MGDPIPAIRSGTVPALPSLAIQLAEIVDDPERSYEDAWDVIKRMARDMRDRQSLILVDREVDAMLHEDELSTSSTFHLLHTVHPRVLRSVCMGTVAYEFHDQQSSVWSDVHSEQGPGAYVVGIAVHGRAGKFLTATETHALINVLQTYLAGCAAWAAREDDFYGELNQQQNHDLTWAMEIDNQCPPAGRVAPSSEMQSEIKQGDGRETEEDVSHRVHRPRFSGSGRNMTTGIHALIAMFQRRLMHGADPNEPQIQSPLLVGSSNDLQTRKQDYRPNVTRFHSDAHLYVLLMSCIKFMGLEPQEVFVPFTKAWEVGQINQGEVLATIVGNSLVSMAGLNVHEPGGKRNENPPEDSVFERTHREVNRRDWFLDNIRQSCDKSEWGRLKKIDAEIFSVTDADLDLKEQEAEDARHDFCAAVSEAETALAGKEAELDEAKDALEREKARQREISALTDEIFADF
ncbi:hypothetical protein PG997_007125 [Apiospora hydei]|uniref:Uncharacterized protein n=1 Tax=Apiospora hydei TaxID=1337664 RepID=A0ABR1WQN7_9PEZI